MKSVKFYVMALVFLCSFAGCGKDVLDQRAEELVQAFSTNNYAAFKLSARPELVAVLPQKDFEDMAKGILKLGAYKDKTMHEIHTEAGGKKTSTYDLNFAKGVVNFELDLQDEKIMRFNFSGPVMTEAMSEYRKEKYATFKVGSFQFLDGEKKPKNNIYKVGEDLNLTMDVYGLAVAAGSMHIKSALKILDAANGALLFEQPNFQDDVIPLNEGDLQVATLAGHISIPIKGSYKVGFVITDVNSGKVIEYAEAFIAEE
jgi:hypothetical protein